MVNALELKFSRVLSSRLTVYSWKYNGLQYTSPAVKGTVAEKKFIECDRGADWGSYLKPQSLWQGKRIHSEPRGFFLAWLSIKYFKHLVNWQHQL
jgi:hypothetical protein